MKNSTLVIANQYLPISSAIASSGKGNLLLSFCESTACVGRENLAYDQRNGTPLP